MVLKACVMLPPPMMSQPSLYSPLVPLVARGTAPGGTSHEFAWFTPQLCPHSCSATLPLSAPPVHAMAPPT